MKKKNSHIQSFQGYFTGRNIVNRGNITHICQCSIQVLKRNESHGYLEKGVSTEWCCRREVKNCARFCGRKEKICQLDVKTEQETSTMSICIKMKKNWALFLNSFYCIFLLTH